MQDLKFCLKYLYYNVRAITLHETKRVTVMNTNTNIIYEANTSAAETYRRGITISYKYGRYVAETWNNFLTHKIYVWSTDKIARTPLNDEKATASAGDILLWVTSEPERNDEAAGDLKFYFRKFKA